jgi:hypothetical protein
MDRYRLIHRLNRGVPKIDAQHEAMANALRAASRATADSDAITRAVELEAHIAVTDGQFDEKEERFALRAA